MANERGHYGSNNVPRVGQAHPQTIYVERGGSSIGKWLLGAAAIGGVLLYARHQARQIEQLYKTSGLPYQSFPVSLRESVRALPTKAREAYRGIVGRARPATGSVAQPAAPPVPIEQLAPAHSVRSRR